MASGPVPPTTGTLEFDVDANDVTKEREFRRKWLKAYNTVCEGTIDRITEVAVAANAIKDRERKKPIKKRIGELEAEEKK